MKVTTKYRCDKCDDGAVDVVTKEVKGTISIDVGSCNKCKASYGVKSVSRLQVIS